MKYDIITGGEGFIGSHLAERLYEYGNNFRAFDKKSGWDITNPINPYYFGGVNTIFHLAALADIVPSIKDPEEYYNTNVTGTLKMLEIARKSGANKFIYAASASCYGIPSQNPVSEKSVIDTRYPYALTKYLGEQLVFHWGKVYGIPVVSLRFFNVYGPRSRTNGAYGAVFGTFIAQMLANKPVTIVGDGTQTRDFIYVDDVIDAIILAVEYGKDGEAYNIGSGLETSVNEIVGHLGAIERVYLPKRPGEPERICADITKAQEDMKWQPKTSIIDGIAKMLENKEYWRDAPVWDANSIAEETKEWFSCLS